jgi:hypothetical protein
MPLKIGAPEFAPGTDQNGVVHRSDFMGEPTRLNGWDASALADHTRGWQSMRRQANASHNRRVLEAGRLYADVISGKLEPLFLQEAMNPRREVFVAHLMENYPGLYPRGGNMALRETMAVTDYQALFADVIDRLYYSNFAAWPITNMPVVMDKDLRDFRQVKRYMYDGLVTPYTGSDPGAPPPQQAMLGPAPQNGTIPPTPATSTAAVTYSPLLYQASASINWAAFVGDDLGIFRDVPKRLAIKGNRGIAKFITQQYCDINGPNTSTPSANPLFQSGYHNQLNIANGASANNARLTIDSLVDAYNILAGQLDATGDPIMIGGPMYLVYGPSDYGTAKNLQNALENFTTQQGGVPGTAQTGQMLRVKNWAMENLTLIYDPYLSLVATNNPHSWFLACDPKSQERPGIEVGFLTGFKEPQLFTEIPTTQRMGGGPDPTMGNFWSNNQNMKIMGVMGASPIDGRSWVGSNGSGS